MIGRAVSGSHASGALGAAVAAYYFGGDMEATFSLERSDGYVEYISVDSLFDGETFPPVERLALNLCRGRVLDVGACVGRHSAALQERGFQISQLEIDHNCVKVLRSRGFTDVIEGDITEFSDGMFDTVILLMNGIGMFGSVERLGEFLGRLKYILSPGGRLLCDSTDVCRSDDEKIIAYREKNIRNGEIPGAFIYRIAFKDIVGKSFRWIYMSPAELAVEARKSGLGFDLLMDQPDGRFLAVISLLPSV